jgi:hypothetical protein
VKVEEGRVSRTIWGRRKREVKVGETGIKIVLGAT